jgi:hypothetical protein
VSFPANSPGFPGFPAGHSSDSRGWDVADAIIRAERKARQEDRSRKRRKAHILLLRR